VAPADFCENGSPDQRVKAGQSAVSHFNELWGVHGLGKNVVRIEGGGRSIKPLLPKREEETGEDVVNLVVSSLGLFLRGLKHENSSNSGERYVLER